MQYFKIPGLLHNMLVAHWGVMVLDDYQGCKITFDDKQMINDAQCFCRLLCMLVVEKELKNLNGETNAFIFQVTVKMHLLTSLQEVIYMARL